MNWWNRTVVWQATIAFEMAAGSGADSSSVDSAVPTREDLAHQWWMGFVFPAALVGTLSLLAGCGSDAGGGNASRTILLQNENNYRATGSLSLPIVVTASGTDLDICWTDVVTDIQCHPVVPQNDLDNVGLLRLLHLNETQAQEKLISDTLQQSEVDGYVEFGTDHTSTCTKLSKFSFFGTAIDVAAQYQQSADETYMLLYTGLELHLQPQCVHVRARRAVAIQR
jgi:hypothetical protein